MEVRRAVFEGNEMIILRRTERAMVISMRRVKLVDRKNTTRLEGNVR